MKVWAFVSQKGGSGRSTLCTQLATYACQIGEKVAVIDLDVQGSAVAWHEIRGRGESPAVMPSIPTKLAGFVEAIRSSGLATMVMIDTPPHTDDSAVKAIAVSDLVICPMRYGMFDQQSLDATIALVEMAKAKDRAIGVVNAIRVGKSAVKDYQKAAKRLEDREVKVAAAYVCDRRAFVQAINEGRGVTERKTKNEAAREIQALWSELSETPPVVIPTKEHAAND